MVPVVLHAGHIKINTVDLRELTSVLNAIPNNAWRAVEAELGSEGHACEHALAFATSLNSPHRRVGLNSGFPGLLSASETTSWAKSYGQNSVRPRVAPG